MADAAALTPAQTVLANDLRAARIVGDDRVAPIFAPLVPALAPELRALADRNDLVCGETGERHAFVRTRCPAGGYAIEMSSGMVLYTELIVRYCSATFVAGATGAPKLDLESVQALLLGAMQTYVRQEKTFFKRFEPAFTPEEVVIDDDAAKWRDSLLHATRSFMLAHEVGHVAIGERLHVLAAGENEETAADAYGLSFALPQIADVQGWRGAIAGAGLSVRIFVSLEKFGFTFGSVYPPQDERLATLDERLRASLGAAQVADEASTVMIALLDLMDNLDARIAGTVSELRSTESRTRIGIIARLIEVANGRLGLDAFVAMLAYAADHVDASAFAAALNAVFAYYWPWLAMRGAFVVPSYLATISYLEKPLLVAMSSALREIVPRLAPEHRAQLDPKYVTAAAT